MPETAAALQGIDGKTIVLTGALSPARFRSTDADFNVGMAVAAVQVAAPGVYIAMSGQVFEAGKVRKNRDANRFEPFVTGKKGVRALLEVEVDALGERQILAPVDRVRLPPHVGLPRVRSGFAAAACLFLTAETRRRFRRLTFRCSRWAMPQSDPPWDRKYSAF